MEGLKELVVREVMGRERKDWETYVSQIRKAWSVVLQGLKWYSPTFKQLYQFDIAYNAADLSGPFRTADTNEVYAVGAEGLKVWSPKQRETVVYMVSESRKTLNSTQRRIRQAYRKVEAYLSGKLNAKDLDFQERGIAWIWLNQHLEHPRAAEATKEAKTSSSFKGGYPPQGNRYNWGDPNDWDYRHYQARFLDGLEAS